MARPAFSSGGRCAMMNTQMIAPTGMAARRMPRPRPSAPLCSGMMSSAKIGSSVTAPPSSTANMSSVMRAEDDFVLINEAETGDEGLERDRFARRHFMLVPDAGDEAKQTSAGNDIDGINHPCAVREPDEHARRRRAEHAGKLERAAVEGDGARQFLARDEARSQTPRWPATKTSAPRR